MRFICLAIAVISVALVDAGIPERTYLPPAVQVQRLQYVSRPQVIQQQQVYRPQNVYLPPPATAPIINTYRPRPQVISIPQRPITVAVQRPVVQRPVVLRPVVQQVVRPQNVYLPPAVVQRPVISGYRTATQSLSYGQPSRTYLPPQGAASSLNEEYAELSDNNL